MNDWGWFSFFFATLLGLVATADLARRRFSWSAELTRKFVHMGTGLLVATTPFLFTTRTPLLVLAGIFAGLNLIGVLAGWFEGMHGTARRSLGTVFFPVTFIILLLWLWEAHPVAVVAAMLVLGVADTVAATVGELVTRPRRFRLALEEKSLQGSLGMWVASWGVVLLTLTVLGPRLGDGLSFRTALLASVLAAFLATAGEAISAWGSDNLSAPLAAALVLEVFLGSGPSQQAVLAVGMVLALAVAALSYGVGFLDAGGAVLVFVMGSLIFGLGGWAFAGPILLFFVASSLLTKLARRLREKVVAEFEKSNRRDLAQVLANGGVATILLLVWHWRPQPEVYFLYLASLAAVTADTWATEIGVIVGMQPRSPITLRRVQVGASGGVSLAGLAAAWAGGALIGVVARISADGVIPVPSSWIWLLAWIGVAASLVDSILGALIQAQYLCPMCGKVTEKSHHCAVQTVPFRGWRWVNNDVVNGVCAMAGVAIASLVV